MEGVSSERLFLSSPWQRASLRIERLMCCGGLAAGPDSSHDDERVNSDANGKRRNGARFLSLAPSLGWQLRNVLPGWSLGMCTIGREFSCRFICLFIDRFREGTPVLAGVAGPDSQGPVSKPYLSALGTRERGITFLRADRLCSAVPLHRPADTKQTGAGKCILMARASLAPPFPGCLLSRLI